jgi:uncharacterized membrane protein (UPF0182 family)
MSSFEKNWQRWFPEHKDGETVRSKNRRRGNKKILIPMLLFVIFIILSVGKGLYSEWLWFNSLSYGSVYVTILKTKVLLFFAAAAIFAAIFLANLVLATRLSPKGKTVLWPWALLEGELASLKVAMIMGIAFLCFIFGMVAQGNWELVLRFFNQQDFGSVDPVFHKEVSFYVFSLPFLQLLKGWIQGAFVITVLGSGAIYFLGYMGQRMKFDYARSVLVHACSLVAVVLGTFAWGYWLDIWDLVFSERGVAFGASYTDIHAQLPAQWILIVAVLVFTGILIVAFTTRKRRLLTYGIAIWIVVSIVVAGVFPSLMQRLQVQPNEFALEKPYIEYNIQATREAFALNRIEEQMFPAEEMPTNLDLINNEVTINNIRLWDHRTLIDTYNQIQAIRLYYDFNDVDVDRYYMDGTYQQVMLSARELSAEKLAGEAQTWVNRRLQFTHGYGVALSPVNEISPEGLPILTIKDIPPVGDIPIDVPQIYFGEKTDEYVIVNTNTQEFDYPMGDSNIYGEWQGEGGVSIGGLLQRAIYAWQLNDFNILISSEMTADSRILYYRNIDERVKHLAPFLQLDGDPYIVIVEGRLYWIQDAYTTTTNYPYSEPFEGNVNYIRNSVKAVIDAYDGDVTFYISDPEDALIQTYQSIFPELFVPIEQMPEPLRQHIRYPEGMFTIQSRVYLNYHMQDAQVFYNKEDLWSFPKEVYSGAEQVMQPYYIIMHLPEEDKEEFLLMLPFTPVNKNNTVGWLAARCDGDNYGKLFAYIFPKDKLVYGPSQIENRIQQDITITEQLALWGRGGSRVIRGNLLMIPLGDSNLFVEPVFLQADAGGLPELKRVIVAAGDQIAMKPTLGESLAAIFGTEAVPTVPGEEPVEPGGEITSDVASLISQAQQHYSNAQQYLKEGDWTGYGKELAALEAILGELADVAAA